MDLKIGLELLDKGYFNMDFSTPERGNPGVGGSEFCFLMLAKYLLKTYSHYQLTIFHYNENILGDGINSVLITKREEIPQKASECGIDILVFQINQSEEWYRNLQKYQVKGIAWAHVYPSVCELRLMVNASMVKRVVFVGKEEYDAYIDHEIIKKAVSIYNMFNSEYSVARKENPGPVVVYMGSLVPGKAFHILARGWPYILKKIPQARLKVIGSGRLYNRNEKLGSYKVAGEAYEKMFIHYLCGDDGKILPSVEFCGVLGHEKTKIFHECAVGVVNPSAKDETFCISAVEMEACGIPIASLGKYGLLDTIKNKQSGLLAKSYKGIYRNIVKLLKDDKTNRKLGTYARGFVADNFSPERLIVQWDKVFQDIAADKEAEYQPPTNHYMNDLKFLKVILHTLKFSWGLHWLPSVKELKYMVKGFIK